MRQDGLSEPVPGDGAAPRRSAGFWIAGAALILAGLLLPQDWYDSLPANPEIPTPRVSGVILFKAVLILEGLILTGLGFRRRRLGDLPGAQRPLASQPAINDEAISHRTATWAIAALTALGLLLRFLNVGSDLWLDEILTALDAREMSALQVVGTYVSSNVHLLNTLLIKLSVALFGETELTVRLPAVLFGSATVPVLYRVSRLALSRGASLGAAFLLAVSYHHIFFSQNARGYVFYLFFSLVASELLVRGLEQNRRRTWAGYIVATLLNFASLLLSGFVFASHILVGAAAVVLQKLRGGSPGPLLLRLTVVFGIAGMLGFQLYSLMLPQVVAFVSASYARPSAGYRLFSREFLQEMQRGLAAGFGTGLLLGVLPFGVLAALGFIAFFRKNWMLATSLSLPILLSVVMLVGRGLMVSPRFLLLGLPLAIITVIKAVEISIEFVGRRYEWQPTARRRAVAVVVLALGAVSVASLPGYYRTPKQPYRASLEHVCSLRQGDEIVVAIHTARSGYAYYGPGFGLRAGHDLFFADSDAELAAILAEHGQAGAFLVTCLHRLLHLDHPQIEARLENDWDAIRTFPATIGDGQITVWRPSG